MLTVRTTSRGQVVVGDLPADFLRLPVPTQSPQQSYSSDEITAQFLQSQQLGFTYMNTPSNVKGKLSVSMAQAKLAKNYGLTKMDPYCRIRIGHAVFETPTVLSGSKNPRWNKSVQCYLPNGVDHVYIEIFDEKTFQADDRIAWAHVPIPERALAGETVDNWYPLSGKQGDEKEGMINLVFSFTRVEQQPAAMQQQPSLVVPQVVMMPSAPGMFYPSVPPSMYTSVQTGAYSTVPGSASVQYTAGLAPPQHMPVHQQAPAMSEDELNQIKDMFPKIDMDVIKSVAEVNRWNKNDTINALLSMAD